MLMNVENREIKGKCKMSAVRFKEILILVVWGLVATATAQQVDEKRVPNPASPRLESRLVAMARLSSAAKTVTLPFGVSTTEDGKLVVVLEPEPGRGVCSGYM